MPSGQRKLALALCGLILVGGTQAARSNMAARSFFTAGKGAGALTAPGTAQLRVRQVSLSLDFREAGRQPSTAEYLLANLDLAQAWEDELVFVSTAVDITVSVDGVLAKVTPYGGRLSHGRELLQALPGATRSHGFRVRLAPGQESRVAISFVCEPGMIERNTSFEDASDGLTRYEVVHERSSAIDQLFFSYPLWPAYGFAGGTGEMSIALLTGPGASPPAGTSQTAWAAQPLPQGETRWTIRLPEARSVANAPMRDVTVRYAKPRTTRWHLGASAFAGLRIASQNESLLAPHLALSADVIIAGLGAIMLGGESAFAHSASLSLAFQRGPVSSWVSAYLGGAVLATFSPDVTPGFELRAGIRLVWLPLDLAFQAHPWAKPGEGDVARWRLLVGLRAGMW